MSNAGDRPASPGYQVFMLVLCLFALGTLAAQTAIHLEPQTRDILRYADYAVCTVFMADFVASLWRASGEPDVTAELMALRQEVAALRQNRPRVQEDEGSRGSVP